MCNVGMYLATTNSDSVQNGLDAASNYSSSGVAGTEHKDLTPPPYKPEQSQFVPIIALVTVVVVLIVLIKIFAKKDEPETSA